MQRKTAVLFIVALLCTMTILSTCDIYRVNNEYFELYVSYNWSRTTYYSSQFINEYDTYTIQWSVSVQSYNNTIGNLQVYDYPFWLDVSNWSQNQFVVIRGHSYEITGGPYEWIAHRSYSDVGISLFYIGDLGFLVGIYIDAMTIVDFWPSGYRIDVELGTNNIGELDSYLSGRYLIYDNLLIIGIFAELAIINWLVVKRRNSKGKNAESSN